MAMDDTGARVKAEKLPWAARLIPALGFGFLLAANSAQGDDPVLGLAVLVVWPALFVLGLAAVLFATRFVLRPREASERNCMIAAVVITLLLAVFPYVRGSVYLRGVKSTIPRYEDAEMVSTDYFNPMDPRLLSLRFETKRDPRAVFAYYDSYWRQAGWTRSSHAPPYWGSWTDSRRNTITLELSPQGNHWIINLLWSRHSS